jgi:hypothetical protein
MRVFHAERKRIPKTEDSLAERGEFELSGDFVNGQYAILRRQTVGTDGSNPLRSANQRQVSGRSPPVQREIPAYAAPFLAAFDFHHRVAYL